MFDECVIAYIRAGVDDEKSVEKQVEEIQNYCDEKDIIAMGFYEEIGDNISEGMIEFLKQSAKEKGATILAASLTVFGNDLKKISQLIKDFKNEGIEVKSLNDWDVQMLKMFEAQ